jgi:hypothetical protein
VLAVRQLASYQRQPETVRAWMDAEARLVPFTNEWHDFIRTSVLKHAQQEYPQADPYALELMYDRKYSKGRIRGGLEDQMEVRWSLVGVKAMQ